MASLHSVVILLVLSLDLGWCSVQLHLSRTDSEVVQGRYDSTDTGIHFNSTVSSLSVTDIYGNQILVINDVIHYQRWIIIQGNVFVQLHISGTHQYQDYYVPGTMYKDIGHLSRQLNLTALKYLRSLSSQFHYENLRTSVQILTESSYARAITNAAYTLGKELKLCGQDYPSILPLYLVANMLEKVQIGSRSVKNMCISKTSSTPVREDSCFDECPPCPDDDCLSLCGYGCNCWKWVCGDCCYHLGCYGHDICCREKFIQTKCLFPISFRCESEYQC